MRKRTFMAYAIASLLLAGTAACSDNDNPSEEPQKPGTEEPAKPEDPAYVWGTDTDGKKTTDHLLFDADGNPLNLWDALARKCTSDRQFRSALQIKLIGKTDKEIVEAIRSRGLGANLQDLGYLPHAETVSAQKGADILMLPLRQEPEYAKVYPGKLFEYLAARRPVLGIGQEDGACAAVLAQTGAGVMYDWDKLEPVQSFIDAQWERFKIGDNCPIHSDISKYERKVLTQKLVELL